MKVEHLQKNYVKHQKIKARLSRANKLSTNQHIQKLEGTLSKKHPNFFVTSSSKAGHKTVMSNFLTNDESAQVILEKPTNPFEKSANPLGGKNLNVNSINEFDVEYEQE